MPFYVHVSSVGGEARELAISEERVVLGSQQSAGICVEGFDEIAPEHAVVTAREGGCMVSAAPGAPTPIVVDGVAHEQGFVPFGVELAIGRVRLRFEDRPKRAPGSRSSPLVIIAPLVVGVAAWMLLTEGDATDLPEAPEAPALFGQEPSCHAGESPAHHHAERREQAGDAQVQRYPFAPRDGVRAVLAFGEAAACYDAASDADAARRARGRATWLRERVEQDYRSSRFRLEHAIETANRSAALDEARVLLSLLEGRDEPYVDWLALLERRLRTAPRRAEEEE